VDPEVLRHLRQGHTLLAVTGHAHDVVTELLRVRLGHASSFQACPRQASSDVPNRAAVPNAWSDFIPFLDYDVEIRKVICSTNAIESLNARYRRAVRARGHFPNEQAAMKVLYLVTRSLDPKGTGQTRWTMRWKPALNAFAITFADRMPAAEDR